MAVILENLGNRYIGLAADAKPTSVPAGSTYFATDSGLSYVYDGTTWNPLAVGAPVGVGLIEVVDKLERISDQLQILIEVGQAVLAHL